MPTTLPINKVAVSISIDKKLWERFKKIAKKVYGKERYYSVAVEHAIILWLYKHGIKVEGYRVYIRK